MSIHAGLILWCTCIARAALNSLSSVSTRTRQNTKKFDEYITGKYENINIKYLTLIIDYGYMGGMLYLLDTTMSEDKFTTRNILLHQAANSILVCMLDVIKVIFFSEANTDNIIMLRKRLMQTFSIKAVMLACFIQVNIGMMYWAPLTDSVSVIGVGKWYELHIPLLLVVYVEYLAISFIKDKIAMQIFIGPLLFCSIQVLLGGLSFSIHYASFFLSVVCDQTIYSLDPSPQVPQLRSLPPQQSQQPQQPQQPRKKSMLRRSSDYVIPLPRILEGNQEDENENDCGLFGQRNNNIMIGNVTRAKTIKRRTRYSM